jgi:hypothetical protein
MLTSGPTDPFSGEIGKIQDPLRRKMGKHFNISRASSLCLPDGSAQDKARADTDRFEHSKYIGRW